MNSVYVSLIEAQLRAFAKDYADTARDVFYDQAQGRIIHPGEFGCFRESLVRELLANFLPEAYAVSQGFILAPEGSVSTQCDIVVYSRLYAPIIRTAEQQRFFPIESVVAVGEVKSTVDGAQLRDAVCKLVRIKDMRAKLEGATVASGVFRDVGPYSALTHHLDQLATFVVACDITCSNAAIENAVVEATGGMPPSYRVNLVLGLGNCCAAYRDARGIIWPYPVDVDPATKRILPGALPMHFLAAHPEGMDHVKLFLRFVQLLVTRATVLYPNLGGYWGDPQ